MFALLEQGEQFEKGCSGEFSAERCRLRGGEIGNLDGKTEAHEVSIGHDDMARALRGMTDGKDPESPPVERVARVGHLDLLGLWRKWVLEGGIKLGTRLTPSITSGS